MIHFLKKYSSLMTLIMLIMSYQYVIVTRGFLVATLHMDRNPTFDILEKFLFVWIGTDIMLFVFLPLATIWSLILSLQEHGWKKIIFILILLFLFLYRFDLVIMPAYFFDM